MESKTGLNCWDLFKCPQADKDKCLAFIEDSGNECWLVASKGADIINSGVDTFDGVKECWNCAFFQDRHFGNDA